MVKKDLGVSSAKDLDGATVCIQTGTTTELNLADFFKSNNITYTPVTVADDSEAQRQYLSGACDAFTTDASGLAATRATMADPENHIILPEIISKEPLGPAVRHGDNQWGDIVRWVYYALLVAEEKGITKANLEEVLASTTDPEVKRLLGADDHMLPLILDDFTPTFETYTDGSLSAGIATYYLRALSIYGLKDQARQLALEMDEGYAAGMFDGGLAAARRVNQARGLFRVCALRILRRSTTIRDFIGWRRLLTVVRASNAARLANLRI